MSNLKNLQLKNTEDTIFTALGKIKDPRKDGGKRHHIAVILLINIMSIMSGYNGILAKQDFVDRNKQELTKLFDPRLIKHGLPSKNSIDRVMQAIDYSQLNKILTSFLKTKIDKNTYLHIDGKAIKGTVQNPKGKQTFTAIVSVFSKNGAIESKEYVNGKKGQNEVTTVREIITKLGLENMVLTLDALHCQKKNSRHHS